MRLNKTLLFVALAASLAACGKVDPESIDDPVDETAQRIVKVSVGNEPDTKVSVNVVEEAGVRQGVVTFSESDRLYLFETLEDPLGGFSTSIIPSSGTILKNDGKSADFMFALSSESMAPSLRSVTYVAAAGDWSLSGSNMEVNIPAVFDMKDNGASVLPQNGVIAMSDPYSGTREKAEKIFSSRVRLNHLVCYGILNISGLPGVTIKNILIESKSEAPIAGKATIQLKDNGSYTDASGSASNLILSTLSINESSAKAISITPSEEVQKAIYDNTGTSIWFSSVNKFLANPTTLYVTLTDSSDNKYYGQFDFSYAISDGSAAAINISTWNTSTL